jgi:hypothetical protein
MLDLFSIGGHAIIFSRLKGQRLLDLNGKWTNLECFGTTNYNQIYSPSSIDGNNLKELKNQRIKNNIKRIKREGKLAFFWWG